MVAFGVDQDSIHLVGFGAVHNQVVPLHVFIRHAVHDVSDVGPALMAQFDFISGPIHQAGDEGADAAFDSPDGHVGAGASSARIGDALRTTDLHRLVQQAQEAHPILTIRYGSRYFMALSRASLLTCTWASPKYSTV